MKRDFVYIFAIIALVLGLVLAGSRCRKSETPIEHKPDTVLVEKIDTLVKEVERLVVRVDTVYIYVDTTYDEPLEVPVVNKTYEDEDFKAVISGPSIGELAPNLDSFEVYPKTTTQYIYTEIEKEVESRKWECYAMGEICSMKSGNFASFGFLVATPNGVVFGPKIGVHSKEFFIGGTFGYRITHRK